MTRRWHTAGAAWLTSFALAVGGIGIAGAHASDAAPAAGRPSSVDELNARAAERFQAKEYDEAARLFEEAHDLDPEPNYLYNIGRVYEEKGDFAAAVEYYERFIGEPGVELDARELALERLRVLRAILAETAAKASAAEPEREASATDPDVDVPPPAATRPPDVRRQRMRLAGYVLLGVGGGMLVAGAGFGGAAVARNRELDSLASLEARNDVITRGKRHALVADIMFISGGVIALTGLGLTLATLKRRSKSQRAALTPTFDSSGAGARLDVRF